MCVVHYPELPPLEAKKMTPAPATVTVDWFRAEIAKAAMQGLCAALTYGPGVLVNAQELAQDAVCIANALITELKEPRP